MALLNLHLVYALLFSYLKLKIAGTKDSDIAVSLLNEMKSYWFAKKVWLGYVQFKLFVKLHYLM